MKILIVSENNNSVSYYRPFQSFGELTFESELLWNNPKEISFVVFTGGADVSPSLYGQTANRNVICVPRRDIFESIVFHKAKSLNIPMVGICRGAQFLNVMAGGKLCQHLDGHNFGHEIKTIFDEYFHVSSMHHQMMLPPPNANVIAWSSLLRSKRYYGENNELITPEKEYEVIHWGNIKAVGMQYHPEIMDKESRGFKFASFLVSEYLLKEPL